MSSVTRGNIGICGPAGCVGRERKRSTVNVDEMKTRVREWGGAGRIQRQLGGHTPYRPDNVQLNIKDGVRHFIR